MNLNKFVPFLFALVLNATLINNVFAATPGFVLDFEQNWDYGSDVAEYYNGGTAYNLGTPLSGVSGTNHGISFTSTDTSAMLGVSNDAFFNYYNNAPTMQGVASPFGTVYMNVYGGVDAFLTFYYASPESVKGAVKAYSGLNGTGTLLGEIDLASNNPTATYDAWSKANFSFTGTALSFDFSAASGIVGFDNISNVPEPESIAMMLVGLSLIRFVNLRRTS